VALSDEAIRDENQVEAVIDRVAGWPVSGFYVVGEVPGAYLVDDPSWLANLLILASGLKLLRKSVIVGYSSHQLCPAACNVDAIASGTWLTPALGSSYADPLFAGAQPSTVHWGEQSAFDEAIAAQTQLSGLGGG